MSCLYMIISVSEMRKDIERIEGEILWEKFLQIQSLSFFFGENNLERRMKKIEKRNNGNNLYDKCI